MEENAAKAGVLASMSDVFIDYYKSILIPKVMDEAEFENMISVYKTQLPIVFRVSKKNPNYENVERELKQHIEVLKSQGIECSSINCVPSEHGDVYSVLLDKGTLRRSESLKSFHQWLKLHTALGQCHRQEFVSMIPPNFLMIGKNMSVLDTCAAPGSKTAQIIEMLEGPESFVVANDSDIRRCHPLVHQLQRVGTQKVLVVNYLAQEFGDFAGELFDRVLCDVPCTGDGTIRKNPKVAEKWQPKNGGLLHALQRLILKRGLELTKEGGICVYSTCSMNPTENEAVINSVLHETGDAVEILDVSALYPGLQRHSGLESWPVYDYDGSKLIEYASPDSVPQERKQFVPNTVFPQNPVPGLKNSMRFFPHYQNSGGFYVCVLQKKKHFDRLTRLPEKEPKPLKEEPYVPLDIASPDVLKQIISVFGFKDDFPSDLLFIRDESKVRFVSILAPPIARMIRKVGSPSLRTVSCGARIFSWKPFGKDKIEMPYPTMEGISVVVDYATKRVYNFTPEEMLKLFEVYPKAVGYNQLSEETRKQFIDIDQNGAIVCIPNSPFSYGGMTFQSSVAVYLQKDLIEVEKSKLLSAYPSIKPL